MSRRTRRRRPCPQCSDMGADAPAVTHRVVYRYPVSPPDLFGPESGALVVRGKVCDYHAHDALWLGHPLVVSVYRLKGAR